VVPPPPFHSFASDNTAGAHPVVLDALRAANVGSALPYGEDPWTATAVERFQALFGADVEVLFTFGGTGANIAGLHSLLAPHEAVVCPENAHINVDECGAPERFIGAKLLSVPAPEGKLAPELLAPLLEAAPHGEHNVRPRVVAISQATELGTVYTVDEVTEIARLAHRHGLLLFVDGARLANAVAALGCSVRELTYEAGVDLLAFGGTKNGLLYGEALVFMRRDLTARAKFARKQAAQLASKMRFIAAQFDALLRDDLWLANAANANLMARALANEVADLGQVEIVQPVQANSVFTRLPAGIVPDLQEWSFFWTWGAVPGLVRWMTSFATRDQDVARFVEGVRYFTSRAASG
jgi:threonine aldolase